MKFVEQSTALARGYRMLAVHTQNQEILQAKFARNLARYAPLARLAIHQGVS
jgi:hypothetical protein